MQPLLKAFFFLSLLACLVTASPTRIQRRSFKVERIPNENFAGRNGPRALLKAYRKFGMPVPDGLVDAANRRAEEFGFKENRRGGKARLNGNNGAGNANNANAANNVNANNNAKAKTGNGTASNAANNKGVGLVQNAPEGNDVEYLSPVTIGGQTLNLDFDSGSSDLWVFNTQLAAKAQTGHTIFDPAKSKTFQLQQGASFSISYGDGSGAAGIVGTDTVNIGGATVTNQAVELATAVSNSFIQDKSNNGLVGLAFSQLNTIKPQPQKTFFDNVMKSLAEPLFTADLRHQTAGAYEFGRVDTSKFTGNMAWVPVNTTNGFWQFSTSKFAVGNGKLQTAVQNSQAIADTGTTLMLSNPTVVNGYYSQVQGAVNDAQAGGITVPCNAQMPDLMLDVGGVYTAVVKGNTLNFSPVDKTNTTCFGGLQATTSGLEVWGDVFFKSQFVAFNGGNNSLGMAQHV